MDSQNFPPRPPTHRGPLGGRKGGCLMGKRKQDSSAVVFNHDGNVDIGATIEDRDLDRIGRGESKIEFVAPGAEKRWRARDLIDIHWALTGIDTPSPSYNRVMSCIIITQTPRTAFAIPGKPP